MWLKTIFCESSFGEIGALVRDVRVVLLCCFALLYTTSPQFTNQGLVSTPRPAQHAKSK